MTNQDYDRNLQGGAGPELGGDPRVEWDDMMAAQEGVPSSAADDGGALDTRQDWSAGAASGGAGGGESAVEKAGSVAKTAADEVGAVAGSAVAKAAEVKDVALERGGDVAAVAKDELAKLAHDARTELQTLWSNTSEQLRVQASAGQKQAADLLHSLAGELGDMASKSENGGPLTSLARQAAAKGSELSDWLSNSEPTDVLTAVRRFARRRPFMFLASAAVAGVVVGRLGRGLMAAAESDNTGLTSSFAGATGMTPATAAVTPPPPVTFDEGPSFVTGEAPTQTGGFYATQPGPGDPYIQNGGAR